MLDRFTKRKSWRFGSWKLFAHFWLNGFELGFSILWEKHHKGAYLLLGFASIQIFHEATHPTTDTNSNMDLKAIDQGLGLE